MAREPIEVRCSALPRIMECPASLKTSDLSIDTSGEAAAVGRAVHDALADVVENGLDAPPETLQTLCDRHGVGNKNDEVAMLVWRGISLWSDLRDNLTVDAVEKRVTHTGPAMPGGPTVTLSGTADVIAHFAEDGDGVLAPRGVVLDWKTGYNESDHYYQVLGYAALAYASLHAPFSEYDEIRLAATKVHTVIVAHLRLNMVKTYEVTQANLLDFGKRLGTIIADENPAYSPSEETCRYCPLAFECQARRKLIEAAGRDVLAIAQGGDHELTPEMLAIVYPQSRMIRQALDAYDRAVKEAVAYAGGRLPSGDGELVLEERTRETIDYDPSIIDMYAKPDSIRLTVGKKELADAVKASAEQGQKGKAIKACLEELRAAGRVTEKKYSVLTYRKHKEEDDV